MRLSRLLCFIGLLATAACMSVAGRASGISPSQFQFVSVIPHEAPGPGGWRAARLVINLLRLPDDPGLVACDVTVQVPEENFRGLVTEELAQQAAARAADIAAAYVAGQGFLSAQLCKRFRDKMEAELRDSIPGARVTRFL